MSDEMINSTKPYNRSKGVQGIGDTVKMMDEHDMNALNNPIASDSTEQGKTDPKKYAKNS